MKAINNGLLICIPFWALVFSSCADAGFYVEFGVAKHGLMQKWWVGRDRTGGHLGLGYLWRPDHNWTIDLGYDHGSQPGLGKPFNDKSETTYDSLILDFRYEWR